MVEDFGNENIHCEICGDSGHIARDCPNRNDKRRIQEYKRMNDDYKSFMDDLGSGKVLGTQDQQTQQAQQAQQAPQAWPQPGAYYGYAQPGYAQPMYGQPGYPQPGYGY